MSPLGRSQVSSCTCISVSWALPPLSMELSGFLPSDSENEGMDVPGGRQWVTHMCPFLAILQPLILNSLLPEFGGGL